MKISRITIGATIATGQYQNIEPVLEITDVEDTEKAIAYGMSYIKDLYARFSTGGELKEKKPLSDSEIIRNMV